MISITATIKSKKENIQQLQDLLIHLVNQTRKETACVRYDLHHSENVFIIWEEWKDQDGLDLHNTQAHLQDFITKSETLVSAPISVYKTKQIL